MEKLNYEKPELDITLFESEDVITTSFGDNEVVVPPDWGDLG